MSSYKQNHGKAGVIYVLTNDAFKNGLFKIGQSTRSGEIRAQELNEDARTGTPALFRCIYECSTQDCGRAEEEIHRILARFRVGKFGQEFFEVNFNFIKPIIQQICRKYDQIHAIMVRAFEREKTLILEQEQKTRFLEQLRIEEKQRYILELNRIQEAQKLEKKRLIAVFIVICIVLWYFLKN